MKSVLLPCLEYTKHRYKTFLSSFFYLFCFFMNQTGKYRLLRLTKCHWLNIIETWKISSLSYFSRIIINYSIFVDFSCNNIALNKTSSKRSGSTYIIIDKECLPSHQYASFWMTINNNDTIFKSIIFK